MENDTNSVDVQFPVNGIAISSGFFPDRPLTSQIANNVRSFDAIAERKRGGSRAGVAKYVTQQIPNWTTGNPIQHLAQLTILDADLIITSFENYTPDMIPDPSSNNYPDGNPNGSLPTGYGNRNPNNRYIPPTGGAGMPARNRPSTPRRRIIATASSNLVVEGNTAQITANLVSLPGDVAVGSGALKVMTIPSGHDGDGFSGTTNISGQYIFNVVENDYEGEVLYIISHTFTNAKNKLVTCTGVVKITWKPNYTLALVSTDGTELPSGTDKHPLVATLTNTSTGAAVTERSIVLKTNPRSRVGDQKRILTDENGKATFSVSDAASEFVVYTASLIPKPISSLPTVTATVTIDWGLAGSNWLIDVIATPQTVSPGDSISVSLHMHNSISGAPGVGYTLTIKGFDADTGFDDLNCNGLTVTTDGSGNASFSTSQPDPVSGVISVDAITPDPILAWASDQENVNWV